MPGPLKELEGPLKAFSKRVQGCYHLSYWERLKILNLQSTQRRFERYRILYTWKCLNGASPNIDIMYQPFNPRLGCMVHVDLTRGALMRHRTLKDASLGVEGPLLYNSLPISLRNMDCSLQEFKNNLDQLLQRIPDHLSGNQYETPAPHNQYCRASNSVKHWISHLRLINWSPASVGTRSQSEDRVTTDNLTN